MEKSNRTLCYEASAVNIMLKCIASVDKRCFLCVKCGIIPGNNTESPIIQLSGYRGSRTSTFCFPFLYFILEKYIQIAVYFFSIILMGIFL